MRENAALESSGAIIARPPISTEAGCRCYEGPKLPWKRDSFDDRRLEITGSKLSDSPEVRITKRTGILQPVTQCPVESDVGAPHQRECQPGSYAEQRPRRRSLALW